MPHPRKIMVKPNHHSRISLTFLLFFFVATLSSQSPTLVVPTGHVGSITAMTTSPDGALLASASLDATVKIWSTADGRERYTYRPGEAAGDLAFSPDGRYLAVPAANELHVLEVGSWREVQSIKGWFMDAAVFHPERNELFYITQKHNSTGEDPLQVWRVSIPGGSPRQITAIPIGPKGKYKKDQLDVSPDGKQLLLVTGENVGHLINTDDGTATAIEGARRFTPEGDLFFVREKGPNVTLGLRRANGTEAWQLPTNGDEAAYKMMTHSAAFGGPDRGMYWVNRPGRLVTGDYRTNGIKMRQLPAGMGSVLTLGANNTLYVAGEKPYLIYTYSLPDVTPVVSFGEEILRPRQLAASQTSPLIGWGNDGRIKLLATRGRATRISALPGHFHGGPLQISDNEQLVAAAATSGDGFAYARRAAPEEFKRFSSGVGATRATATNATGDRLLVVGADGFLVMNTQTHKFFSKTEKPEDIAHYGGGTISPNGDRVLLEVSRKVPGATNTNSHTQLLDVTGKAVVWERQPRLENPAFSPNGKVIHGHIYQYFVRLDAATGRELNRWPIPAGRFPRGVVFNSAGTMAAYNHDDRGYVYDLTAGREYPLSVPGENRSVKQQAFLPDDFLVTSGSDEMIELWDLRTRRRVAHLVQYATEDDWAVTADNGRFDASAGAMRKMYYLVNGSKIPLEQLYEGFYTPGLLGRILERSAAEEPAPPVNINRVTGPPEVSLSYSAGTRNLVVEDDEPAVQSIRTETAAARITVRASAPGGSVREIRLYHNGKLVGNSTRNLVVEDDSPAGNERVFNLQLLPGENDLRAVAINSQGTESAPALLRLTYSAPASAPAKPAAQNGITLHLLTIGINEYKNPRYNLNYAGADADGLETALQSGMRNLVGAVKRYHLRNDQATRTGILSALQTITSDAQADDVFIFYYAGHGVMSEGAAADFFLVPYDVTQLYGNDAGLAAKGISATELKQLAAAVPAQKQLYLLDACQSAGAVQSIALRGAAEEKAIAQLARSTGTHWLTASGKEQFASEFDQLGHGAFTFSLLEALAGKAAGADTRVTVNELKAYLDQVVPELTEKYTGQAQYPASYGFGQDFPVSIK